MSAPRGEERPPVSCLLYRLPPSLSPPLTFAASPTVFSHYLAHFLSLSPSIACFLQLILHPHPTPPPVLSSQQFLHINTRTHKSAHKRTPTPARRTLLFKARSKRLKFYLNECLLFLLPRCVCVGRHSNKHASVCVLVCVTCTAEGEGLTVGDKPDRPARCDYHPPYPLSLSLSLSLSHAHTHTHLHTQCLMRECVARI